MQELKISAKIIKNGFEIIIDTGKEKLSFPVIYPREILSSLPKNTISSVAETLAYAKTTCLFLIERKNFFFDFAKPKIASTLEKFLTLDLPRIFAEEKNLSPKDIKNRIKKNVQSLSFLAGRQRKPNLAYSPVEGAALGISFGKDSLLSYALLKELKIPYRIIYVDECYKDLEDRHKKKLIAAFKKEFQEQVTILRDKTDRCLDNRLLNPDHIESIGGINAMTVYLLLLVPSLYEANYRYVIFGNEQNFNDTFAYKGYKNAYPSVEQSSWGMQKQNKIIRSFLGPKSRVLSLVEPLYNLAEMRILYNRYPRIARYQMSCSRESNMTKKERWCYACPMCAKTFLYTLAVGSPENLRAMRFSKNLFARKYLPLYPLFNPKPDRPYEMSRAVRDEQLLAFLLVYRKGIAGELINFFKKNYLNEALRKEKELREKFFKPHPGPSLPRHIKIKLWKIFRDELKDLQT